MGLFDGLDTPKWQDPGEVGRSIAGGVRNVMSFMQMMQGNKEFAANQAFQLKDQALRSKESDAVIAARASAQKLTDFQLSQEIDATNKLSAWMKDFPTNDIDAILAKSLPDNPKAAVEAIKIREGAARAAALGAAGERRASFWSMHSKLDAQGASAVDEYMEGRDTPSWQAWKEMEVQQDRMKEEEIAAKERLTKSAQDAALDRMTGIEKVKAEHDMSLQKAKQEGRMEVVSKQLEARATALSQKKDPKEYQIFRAKFDAAKEKGDFDAMDRVVAEFETGQPVDESPGFAATRATIERRIKVLAEAKVNHQKELASGDKKTRWDWLPGGRREDAIKNIDAEIAQLESLLKGGSTVQPAQGGNPSAAPSSVPRLRWNSSTNSFTK